MTVLENLLTGVDPIASWWLAIIVLVVVSAVVWLLLYLVARTAEQVETAVAEVWEHGQRVANNTIHIPKLYEVAGGVEAILGRAGRIAASAEALKSHAESPRTS